MPHYFHKVLPIQGDNYEPDLQFLDVVKRTLWLAHLPVEVDTFWMESYCNINTGISMEPFLKLTLPEVGKVPNSQSP
jgi:hypothetical protein